MHVPTLLTHIYFYTEHYQVDMLQLHMLIADYYYTFIDVSLHNSFISSGQSYLRVAYLQELFLMSCLMKLPSSEEWHIAVGP
jgi:hypothetical protein